MTSKRNQNRRRNNTANHSTGPISKKGKDRSSKNAIRHGILSTRLLLDDENAEEFDELLSDLEVTLRPNGALEHNLLERIAVTIWRQARLERAETATLELQRQEIAVADAVAEEIDPLIGFNLRVETICPIDPDALAWFEIALDELSILDSLNLEELEATAPHCFAQLCSDAEGERKDVSSYLATHENGLEGYLSDLRRLCRDQLFRARRSREQWALAEQVRTQRLVPSGDLCHLFARYQTTLDNQLYKAIRAFREAQEWRLSTMDTVVADPSNDL